MSDIYRIENKGDSVSKRMDKMIVVTSAPLWLILLGGVIVAAAILIWSCTGWLTESVSATGVYHPGASEQGEIVAFLPISSGKRIEEGMEVTIYASGYNQQEYGHLKGTIVYVDSYIATAEEMKELLGDESLISAYSQSGPLVGVICKLQEDAQSPDGYYWSNQRGESVTLHDGTYMSMSITLLRMRPIVWAIPDLQELFGEE